MVHMEIKNQDGETIGHLQANLPNSAKRINYAVGSKVVIRKNLVVDKKYGVLNWYPSMTAMSGKTVKISNYLEGENDMKLENGWFITKQMVDKWATKKLQGLI